MAVQVIFCWPLWFHE